MVAATVRTRDTSVLRARAAVDASAAAAAPPPSPPSAVPSPSTASLSLLLAAVAAVVLMPMVVHNGHKGPVGGGSVSGRRRLLRAVSYVMGSVLVFLVLCRITGTFAMYEQVSAIVANEETSLRTGAGIAKFCRQLQSLGQENRFQVILLVTGIYMFLQTFCVPGTVVLNAAVGAVLGTLVGVPYCTLLGTLGASSCYFLSKMLGVSLVEAADARLMKGHGLPNIRAQVRRYKQDLFVYMLFLRLTPILPNWLVNLASPVVGVPLRVFAGATFLGIVPQTYLTVRFGAMARGAAGKETEEDRPTSIVTPWDTLLLAVIGAAILAGFRLKKRLAASSAAAGGGVEDVEIVDANELGGRVAKKRAVPLGGM